MPRLYLVRHGEPAGTWGQPGAADPGLTPLGLEQAAAAAKMLQPLGPKAIVSSPLRRAVETSAPLAKAMGVEASIVQAVAEIPSPTDMPVEKRGDWLRGVMEQEWHATAPLLRQWRDSVVTYLAGLQGDTAIFSHFVAINVAVGAAIGDERVLCFRPAHASVTVLETKGRAITLVELGETADTAVR